MSKVLLINGSPRKNGNTCVALEEIAKTLNDQSIETEIAWIGVKPVRGCMACGKCQENGNGKCIFTDDICNEMIDKINEADALVVGSPVYYAEHAAGDLTVLEHCLWHESW